MRKHLRKMLAMIMVVVIVLSLAPNVFAANSDTLEFTNLYDYKTSGMYNTTIWHKYSDYIPVTAGDVIHIGPCVPTQSFHIVQFNSGKGNLNSNVKGADMSVESTFPNGLVVYKWTVPAGTSYIRVPNNICVDEVFVITKNEPFTAEDCYTYWAQTDVEYDALVSGGHTNPTPASQIQNLFDASKTVSGAYGDAGTLENVSYATTELIAVSEGDKLYFGKTTLQGKYQLKTFDAQKNSVGNKIQSPECDIVQMFSDATAILCYTVPAGVSYVAMSCETAYKNAYLLTKNQPFNETIMNEVLGIEGSGSSGANSAYLTKDPDSVLKGVKIGFFGDSISAANKEKGTEYDVIRGWAGRIGYKNQMEYYNMSVSGSSISTARAKLIYSQIVGSKNQTNGPCDVYVMHGGTNDAWERAPIGDTDLKDFSGDYDYTTFAGGLDKCLYTLKQQYPNAKICYIINYRFTNPGSSKMQLTQMDGYVNMTKKICDKWGVPYLDLYSNNTLLASLKSETTEFLYDGVHLTSAGYELVTPYIEEFLKQVVTNSLPSGSGTPDSGTTTPPVSNNGKTQSISMTLNGFGLSANENVDDATEAAHKADTINKQFGDIIVTVHKGESTKDSPKVFGNETRVYGKNTLSIAPAKGYKITSITMLTQARKPIGTALAHASTVLSNATTNCASGENLATFKPVDGTKAVVIAPGEQFRVISIEVTYEETSVTEPEPQPEPEPESAKKTETVNTTYQSFDLTADKQDDGGNPYYQNGNFNKTYEGFTISFATGTATKNDPAAYGNEVRLYDGNILTITPAKGYKITSIVINSQSKKPLGNTIAHLSTIVSNATVSCDVGATTGIFTPVNGTKPVELKSGEQVRITSIEVTYEPASDEGGNNGPSNPNEVLTNYETFELLTNKMDSSGNPYYQESGFLKTFDFFTISFGNGISEKDFVAAYGDSVHVYPGNTLTISPVKGYKITSIVVHSKSEKPVGSAVLHLSSDLKNATVSCQMGDTTAVLTPADGTKAIVVKPGEQMWITSIEVIYEEATAGDSSPEPTEPSDSNTAKPGDTANEEGPDATTIIIIVAVVVVLAGGATAAVLILRKKTSSK